MSSAQHIQQTALCEQAVNTMTSFKLGRRNLCCVVVCTYIGAIAMRINVFKSSTARY